MRRQITLHGAAEEELQRQQHEAEGLRLEVAAGAAREQELRREVSRLEDQVKEFVRAASEAEAPWIECRSISLMRV